MMTRYTIALAAMASVAQAATYPPDQIEFFEKQIRPILAESCTDCHNSHRHENGLRFDSQSAVTRGSDYGPVVVPGNPAASKMIKAVKHQPGVEAMPKKGGPLKPDQIALLEKWIQMGAPWPADREITHEKPKWQEHWAFQKVVKPQMPVTSAKGLVAGSETKQQTLITNPLDAFVLKTMQSSGLQPAPPADAATLARRLYLTVTGLQPTYDEVQQFKTAHARDPRSAVRNLVEGLLASPHYGERWARYWLDVARYSDTEGYQVAGKDIRYPYAYTYRAWVVSSLNADMPYDRFVMQQLAADRMVGSTESNADKPAASDLAALGFLTVNDTFIGSKDLQTDDRIDATTRGLLGLTVACARCHDHKYDPIPAKDYYALYSMFSSSEIPEMLPVIGKPASEIAYASYKAEIAKVEEKKNVYRKEVYDDIRKLDRMSHYLGFVQEVRTKKLEGDTLRGRAGQLQLRDKVSKKWQNLITDMAWEGPPHGVLIAWKEFSALPESEFAAKAPEVLQRLAKPEAKCYPEVLQAFTSKPAPKNFADVASTYAAMFVKHLTAPPAGQKDSIYDLLMRPTSPLSVTVEKMDELFTRKDLETVVRFNNELKRIDLANDGAPPRAMVMLDKPKPNDVRVFIRGNPGRPGEVAPRGNLTVLGGQKFTDGSGRLEFAKAVANRDNPLTARVIVNRVWMQHFGKPLVAQPSDFGVQTDKPVQAELLDYLAATFMDEGWSLKTLHRMILTSATYQQSSQSTPDKETKDAENNLLTRFNRQRLDYEAMRDAVVNAAGVLNTGAMGGRPVELNAPTVDGRRTLYHIVDRYDQATVPAMFDFANPDSHSPQRFVTTVPQQALFLMNSPFMQRQASSLSSKLPIEGSTADSQTIKALYHRVLLRDPQPDEVDLAQRFLSEAGTLQGSEPFRWTYGTHRLSRDPSGKVTLSDWKPFGVFKDRNKRPTYSPADELPSAQWGHAMMYDKGGHAPKDDLVVTRRWTAPFDAMVHLFGDVIRDSDRGNGVRALIISSRTGLVKETMATPQQKRASMAVDKIEVKKGDVLDFAISSENSTDSDSFEWVPEIHLVQPDGKTEMLTHARLDFCGKDAWPLNRQRTQSPLTQLAQALMMSNEFMFVD
jgi:hypothetical protein